MRQLFFSDNLRTCSLWLSISFHFSLSSLVSGLQAIMWTWSPKLVLVRLHGAVRYGLILSCEWQVCFAILSRLVVLVRLVIELLLSLGWRGGGACSFSPFLHDWGSRCMTGLVTLSLLNLIAHCFLCRLTWCLIGGIEASISSASIGVVRKAAHISLSARLCTFSSGLI